MSQISHPIESHICTLCVGAGCLGSGESYTFTFEEAIVLDKN